MIPDIETTNEYSDISMLESKILDQEQEILKLKEQIRLLSLVKEYDC